MLRRSVYTDLSYRTKIRTPSRANLRPEKSRSQICTARRTNIRTDSSDPCKRNALTCNFLNGQKKIVKF